MTPKLHETLDQRLERLEALRRRVILHVCGLDIPRTEPGTGKQRTSMQLLDIWYEMTQAQRQCIRLLEDAKLELIRRVKELEAQVMGG